MIIHATSQPILPSESGNNTSILVQADEFGSVTVRNEELWWAEQGKYFKVTNPTWGTGLAMGIQTAFSDTANVLLLMRNSSTTKKVIPHYIRLICTAAGATTTSSQLGIVTDTATRYSSGGTDLTGSIVNSSSAGSNASSIVDQLRWNCTALAAVAKRQVGRAQIKTQAAPCFTVGDEIKIMFNSMDGDMGLLSGSGPGRFILNFGPIILEGANHTMLVHMWNPGNATTAPSFEIEIAWWER